MNSPVRAWNAVGGTPRFIQRARGSEIVDADGRTYIDYVASWGPMILGHAHAKVVQSVHNALKDGLGFGAPTVGEVEMAKRLTEALPSMDLVRLVSTGTEATMTAIRLARAYTKRTKVIKFDGCYHGHSDALLVRAGSGAATFGIPDSEGVPEAITSNTLVARFNNLEEMRLRLEADGDQIAAIIVEPVVGNMGVIPPRPGFLEGLRRLTDAHGCMLIFDEVITGFRLGYGGAQERFGIGPDLTCLGKIMGGGLPLAAVGGKREIMEQLAPLGRVYQAGTLSGNPLALAAGLETLAALRKPGVYEQLERLGVLLEEGLRDVLRRHGVRACINRVGSMWTLFFGVESVHDAEGARACDVKMFARFFHRMLDKGIYLPPSPFEAAFLSLAHGESDVERTVWATDQSLAETD